MSFADILIIYLAFGSPLMMHRYLGSPSLPRSQKIRDSLVALAFWVPLVAQMGYRHFSNAYFKHDFVSRHDLDVVDRYISEIRSVLKTELAIFGGDFSRADFFETLERYAALAAAYRVRSDDSDKARELLAVAGRDSEIGSSCLVRRNRRRIKHHHIRARGDLVDLLGKISKTRSGEAACHLAIRIARQLEDPEFEQALGGNEQGVDRSWITEQRLGSDNSSTPLRSLAIAISPRSSD